MLLNRGYADRTGNPVPDTEREKQSTAISTMTIKTWTREEMNEYLVKKYDVKVAKS